MEKALIWKIYDVYYWFLVRLSIKPRIKKKILIAAGSEEFRTKYGKEIDYCIKKNITFFPYNIPVPNLLSIKVKFDCENQLFYSFYHGRKIFFPEALPNMRLESQ